MNIEKRSGLKGGNGSNQSSYLGQDEERNDQDDTFTGSRRALVTAPSILSSVLRLAPYRKFVLYVQHMLCL